ncbi:MAG: hypothetical protein ACWGOY_15150 [Anaerolineales bacterium]
MNRTNTTNTTQKHKHVAAIAAALVMTLLIGGAVLAFGVNAILNQNFTTTAQAAGLTGVDTAISQAASDQALIDQLQAQISEYQAREAQYQTELKDAADQINQLSLQGQQSQALISALVNAGVINITSDGRVFIPRTRSQSFEREGNGD